MNERAPIPKFRFPSGVLQSLKPYRTAIGLSVAAMIGDSLLTALRPWPLKIVIDRVISQRHTKVPIIGHWINHVQVDRMTLLYACCAGSLLIATGTGLLTFYYTRTLGNVGQQSTFNMKARLFSHLQRLPLLFHDAQRTGDLMSRLTSDAGAVQDVISGGAITLVTNVSLLAAMLCMMFWLNWQFALVALAASPVLMAIVFRSSSRIKVLAQEARLSDGLLASLAQETLSSIRVVQGLAQEEHQDHRFQTQGRVSLGAYGEALRLRSVVAPLVDIMAAAGLVAVMFVGTRSVMAGSLTTGDVIVFFAYVTNLYAPIRALSRLSFTFTKASIGLERINEVLDVEPDVSKGTRVVDPRLVRGRLDFENVCFAYPDGPMVLDGINLTIEEGETVALIGATGAGKSTLVSLLPRLYEPSSGRVTLDGVDLQELEATSLRNCIGLVLQESLLFNGTIRDNIAFGKPGATEDEIIAAAKAAHAHEFIIAKKNGYESRVSERGNSLSGGQKQRVAIARAMLRNAPILIMDEPTTGLDAAAEMVVMQAIERAAEGRTTILIAHRLSTVRFASRIFVLENHQIAEAGSHAELMARDGIYARLFRMQFGEIDFDDSLAQGVARPITA